MTTASSYKVFARTYRPKSFGEIMGQDVAVRIFQNALQQNTLSHAILLTGIRGIGKTTSARLLAKSLCCLSPVNHTDPCGTCDSCVAFDKEQHTDIVEMDAASHTGVDDVREIIEGVAYIPTFGRYRVYIIDEVHMLSKNAFNALLKTLEEPPAHAKFIFATTEIEKVPDTIVSRCLQIQLRPMSIETILSQLQKVCTLETLAYNDDGLGLIAEAAQGSMRDALSILEKVASFIRATGETMTLNVVERILGRPPKEEFKHLCDGILKGDVKASIELVRSFFGYDIQALAIAKSLLKTLHASLCHTISVGSTDDPFFKDLAVHQLNRLWSIVHQSVQEIKVSPVPEESCEVMMIRLCHVSDLPPLKQLIEDIEHKIASSDSFSASMDAPEKPLVRTPVASKSKTRFTSFHHLIEWVETLRDPHLSFFVKRDLRVHGFKPGYIECSLVNAEQQHVLRQLKQQLQVHLNESWTFEVVHSTAVSPESEPTTFHEQQLNEVAEAKQKALETDLIQHALSTFDGAQVTVETSNQSSLESLS